MDKTNLNQTPDPEALTLMNNTITRISKLNQSAAEQARKRLDSLTKPKESLGRLEELAKQIAAITGVLNPDLSKKLVIVMAADHGVTDEGVSAYPKEVTPQMVHNFLNGGAGINILSKHIGADVIAVDTGVAAEIGVPDMIFDQSDSGCNENLNKIRNKSMFLNKKIGFGTKNMVKGPAMTFLQAVSAIEAGITVSVKMIEKGYGIIGTGDMGIGNTTASSAIASCICGIDASLVTGYGTGLDEKGYSKKVEVINTALMVNKPDPRDGIDVLSKIGGFEIGGIAGVILGCASKKVPVVIDGFISGAGALIAEAIAPECKNYMIASHCSVERGHRLMLEKLNLRPLFNFDMRLGEGTGAALGISIAEAAMKILNEMATFDEAGVSEKNG